MSAPVAFDARALTEPVDRRAVREWLRAHRGSGSGSAVAPIVVVVIAAAVGAVVFLSMAGGTIPAIWSSMTSGVGLPMLLPFLVLAVVLVVLAVIGIAHWRSAGTRSYRLDAFARANGMTYTARYAAPPLPGMIFSQGSAREASDLVRGQRPRFVEFANYRYTTGSGKNKKTHRWGYVAVRLDVPLPHIVLDATSNNGLFGSNLPISLNRQQRLSLEGDFDQYFSLYCPTGYERDALYLFTPDIMARFIDHAAALDVEIVDDWLFLYAKRDFSTLDPATWAWLFSVVRALLDKLAQWARWRDERLRADDAARHRALVAAAQGASSEIPVAVDAPLRPPPGVAAPGRRLRKGVPWATGVAVVVVVVFWLVTQSGLFFR